VVIIDDQLKGSDFFNVKAEPVLIFKSRSVRSTGAGAAEMNGDITVKGITKPVTLAVTLRALDDPGLKWSAGAKIFVAATRIKRSDFNMTSFESMVGDELRSRARSRNAMPVPTGTCQLRWYSVAALGTQLGLIADQRALNTSAPAP
jgi:polyisoprenoid-binding protein YceI